MTGREGADARRWRQVEDLFQEACAVAPAERDVWLARRCPDDSGLRRDVSSLLAASSQAQSFLEQPAFGLTQGGLDPVAVPATMPARLGPWRPLRLLGHGGMGVVYEAVHVENGRHAAVKVLRTDALGDEHRRRLFEREARSLARLAHQSIAGILDAGRTSDGLHYVALELVQGVELSEHVRRSDASRRERLLLFAELCAAVDYAHRRGVIHRDLKPANILVTPPPDAGTPGMTGMTAAGIKILDFGLARITEPHAGAPSTLTEPGRVIGTLPYMSPEQAQGRAADVDERSDIYALGVILFELLTGRLPCELRDTALHEAVRVICEVPPRRPSTLDGSLRGDLDTIVLKALEKLPARRYASAAELLGDVQRHLAGQPIVARPPSLGWELAQLVRRHRAAVLVGLGVIALVLVAAVWLAVLASQARDAERRARVEARTAQTVNAILTELLSTAHPAANAGPDLTVRELLDTIDTRMEQLSFDDPLVEAGVRANLGTTFLGLGRLDAADRHLTRALELQRTLLGAAHASTAGTLSDLARLRYAQGRYADGETSIREALAIRPKAQDLAFLAGFRRLQGDAPGAEALYREALALHRTSAETEPAELAGTLKDLAGLLGQMDRADEGLALMPEVLALVRAEFGEQHAFVANALNTEAILRQYAGDFAGAETVWRDVLAMQRSALGDEHPDVTNTLNALGNLLRAAGDAAGAEPLLREALERRRSQLGDRHPLTTTCMNNLGLVLQAQGQREAAEALYREALAVRRELLGPGHPDVATVLYNLAVLLASAGDLDGAREAAQEALEILEAAWPQGHSSVDKVRAALQQWGFS